jgi:hypothetical protein
VCGKNRNTHILSLGETKLIAADQESDADPPR